MTSHGLYARAPWILSRVTSHGLYARAPWTLSRVTSHGWYARAPWTLSRVTSCLYYMYSTHTSFCIIFYLLIIGGIETNPGPLHCGYISIVHNNAVACHRKCI